MLLLTILIAAGWLGDQSLAQSDDTQGAACQCVAVDYADGGSYLVNANEDGNFSYASIFEGGCVDNEISSVLRDPDNKTYECSAMRPGVPGSVQISECGISYFDMKSGLWQIAIQLPGNTTVTRTFTLTVGAASTVVTTVTPTLVIGTTQTLPPQVVPVTSQVTADLTLPRAVVTSTCAAGRTLTTTIRGPPTLIIESQIVLQVSPGGTRTSSITITRTLTGSCRYSTTSSARTVSSSSKPNTSSSSTRRTTTTSSTARTTSSTPQRTTVTVTTAPATAGGGLTFTLSGSICGVSWQNNGGAWGPPWARGGGGAWGGGPPPWITSLWQNGVPPWVTQQPGGALPTWVSCTRITTSTASRPRRSAPPPAIRAAWTSTYVQTTYTETLVTTHVLPPSTVTRYIVETVVQTITPAATTLCVTAPESTQVVTIPGPLLTQITLVTSTRLTYETVFVNETVVAISNDIAAATSCLQNGGSYGIQP